MLAAGAPGCYSYIPAEAGVTPPGEQVRVYVTQEALTRMGELPIDQSSVLNGVLIRTESTNLVVRLPVARRQTGFNMEILGQDVFIPRDQVLQLQRRRMNRGMTGLLTVAGTAALAGLVVMIISDARQGEQHPTSGDSELSPRSGGAR